MENTENFDSEINDVRSFERLLRGNGFSRTRAKAITAKGFRATDCDINDAATVRGLIQSLKVRQISLESKAQKRLKLKADVWSGWKEFNPRLSYRRGRARAKINVATPIGDLRTLAYEVEYWRAPNSDAGDPVKTTVSSSTKGNFPLVLLDVADPANVGILNRAFGNSGISVRLNSMRDVELFLSVT